MGSDARIDQLEGRSPESCLSWLRSHEGCPQTNVQEYEYFVYQCRDYTLNFESSRSHDLSSG